MVTLTLLLTLALLLMKYEHILLSTQSVGYLFIPYLIDFAHICTVFLCAALG